MWKRKTHVGCLREAEARLTPGTVRIDRVVRRVLQLRATAAPGVLNMESTALSFVEPGRRVSVHELERWASLAAASAVIVYGFSRRSVPTALLAAAAATPIAYRGLVGKWPFENGHAADDTRSALAGRRGHSRPRVDSPRDAGGRGVSLLAAAREPAAGSCPSGATSPSSAMGGRTGSPRGPAGLARRVGRRDHQRGREQGHRLAIAARSPTSSPPDPSTSRPVRGGRGTQVSVHLQYAPPAGRAGAFVATLFGREPSQTIREDLRRFKQLLEAGEIPRAQHDGEPSV